MMNAGTLDNGLARLALACLSDSPSSDKQSRVLELYSPSEDGALFDFAKRNRIAPLIAHALQDVFKRDTPEHWLEIHSETERRIQNYLAELDLVAADFDRSGIRLVALKNGGIARGLYPCAGCCPMGDLDVLVERAKFREAHSLLLAQGFRAESRSPLETADLDSAELAGSAEYYKFLPTGDKLWFELQWRPVAGRWIRPDQEPKGSQLLERSVSLGGTKVRLLSPVDNLLQVALHTAKHTYVRAPGIRLHTDVDRITRRTTIDWDLFLEVVNALRVKTAVFFSLALPRALLESPIPPEVLKQLRPSNFKERTIRLLLQRAGLFDPDERKFSNPTYIFFNAMLYDELRGLWRAVFPDRAAMRERYGAETLRSLPAGHLKRLRNLVWRRTL